MRDVRRTACSVVAAALVAAALAACGDEGGGATTATGATSGGDRTATVVTGPDGTVTAVATIPGAADEPGPELRPDTAAAFHAYLAELEPILAPVMDFDAMTDRVEGIFGDLSQGPDDSWDEAAGGAAALSEDMREASLGVLEVAPPKALQSGHSSLVGAYSASSAQFGAMERALHDHDVEAMQAALDASDDATQPTDWLVAMDERSKALGVPLPAWLDRYVEQLT